MTTTALVTVLLAALFHALWNLAAKNSRGDSTIFVWSYFTLGAVLALPVGIVQLLREADAPGWELLLAPAVSALFHIAYSMLLQTGYKHADLGVVYPVARGVGPLLAVTIAVVFLGENVASTALAGGMVIIMGILVVTGRRLFRSSSGVGTGLFYGVAMGVAISAYTLWDDFSVTELGILPVVHFGLSAAVQSLVMLPWVVRKRMLFRQTVSEDRREIAIVAVLSTAAYILVLYALQTTSVALVAPLRESSIVIGALLAWWLFKEPDPVRRITGALVVAVGIVMVAVS